jgi:acetylornithine deacetylase/succinyl-diaminopimelate desuccinylase-like protein
MRDSYLEDYYSFLRFPSVSTDQAFAGKLTDCAQWVVKKLQSIGLEAELVPTAGHPIVWGRNKHQPGRRTVMIYGHYDVQPPDPLDLWDSPPFEPVLKNGYVFARGATDNKGQILSHILGVQEMMEEDRDLPVNLHFVIEGEEEIGSGNLPKFLSDNAAALKCDVAVVSDTGMVAKGVPTISYGLRGVTALEVKITGAKVDLHSGIFGGAVANPITALARLLATLHDAEGHVAIEGFYDKVKPLEDWERKAWRELPIDGDKAILDETGAPGHARTNLGTAHGGDQWHRRRVSGHGDEDRHREPCHGETDFPGRARPGRRGNSESRREASAKTSPARRDDGNHSRPQRALVSDRPALGDGGCCAKGVASRSRQGSGADSRRRQYPDRFAIPDHSRSGDALAWSRVARLPGPFAEREFSTREYGGRNPVE